nr:reverse transcriptase domain-containing protein [Tanacetum cinerariifolium]
YIPKPVYLEYLALLVDDILVEDKPLPADASLTSLSPGYTTDSNPKKDLEEDPKEDPADYPVDEEDKEEEHLALADSFDVHNVDTVPSAEDAEEFETGAHDHVTRAIMRIQELEAGARIDTLEDTSSIVYFIKMSPKRTATTTTHMTDAQIKALIPKGVATALAEYETTRSRNGDDSHDSRTGVRRQAPTARECTYSDFLKCQPLNFKGTEGVAGNGNILARAYAVGTVGTNPNSNVVTGMFLLNNRYASILFDTGADMSFVSTTFWSLIDIIPTTLDYGYDFELADGKIIMVNTLIRGYTLNFLNHPFNIDLMPIELGSFDVIIGMDWLSRYHAVIDCAENIVSLECLLHEPSVDDNLISGRSSSRHSTLEVDRTSHQFLEANNGSSPLAYLILGAAPGIKLSFKISLVELVECP